MGVGSVLGVIVTKYNVVSNTRKKKEQSPHENKVSARSR